ncbi:hypothetical protein BSR55_15995 [Acinetobacter bereziniae]|nr:hypothetical protein BSR55_15995 [Acinetobacter bereziniae]
MLIFCKHPPRISISKLQQCWLLHKHKPFIMIFDYIFKKISAMFKWVFRILKKLGSFIKEFIVEVIFQLIIRSIFNLIKAIFHLLVRILD